MTRLQWLEPLGWLVILALICVAIAMHASPRPERYEPPDPRSAPILMRLGAR